MEHHSVNSAHISFSSVSCCSQPYICFFRAIHIHVYFLEPYTFLFTLGMSGDANVFPCRALGGSNLRFEKKNTNVVPMRSLYRLFSLEPCL